MIQTVVPVDCRQSELLEIRMFEGLFFPPISVPIQEFNLRFLLEQFTIYAANQKFIYTSNKGTANKTACERLEKGYVKSNHDFFISFSI